MATPTRPSGNLPQWAINNQVDPTTGKNNAIEPDTAHKDYGWPFDVPPPRNFDNWMKRKQMEWTAYLDKAVWPPYYIKDLYLRSIDPGTGFYEQLQVGGGWLKMDDETPIAYKSGTSLSQVIDPYMQDWAYTNASTPGIVAQGVASLAGDTWIHVFAVSQATGGAIQIWCDTDIAASNIAADPTKEAGYTVYRRIGSLLIVQRAGPIYEITPFSSVGDYFMWENPWRQSGEHQVVVASAPPGALTALAVDVPPDVHCIWKAAAIMDGSGGPVAMSVFPGTMVTPPTLPSTFPMWRALNGQLTTVQLEQATDTSQQVYWHDPVGPGPGIVWMAGMGYVDFRGKER